MSFSDADVDVIAPDGGPDGGPDGCTEDAILDVGEDGPEKVFSIRKQSLSVQKGSSK